MDEIKRTLREMDKERLIELYLAKLWENEILSSTVES